MQRGCTPVYTLQGAAFREALGNALYERDFNFVMDAAITSVGAIRMRID